MTEARRNHSLISSASASLSGIVAGDFGLLSVGRVHDHVWKRLQFAAHLFRERRLEADHVELAHGDIVARAHQFAQLSIDKTARTTPVGVEIEHCVLAVDAQFVEIAHRVALLGHDLHVSAFRIRLGLVRGGECAMSGAGDGAETPLLLEQRHDVLVGRFVRHRDGELELVRVIRPLLDARFLEERAHLGLNLAAFRTLDGKNLGAVGAGAAGQAHQANQGKDP
jgi:hypothetical protein